MKYYYWLGVVDPDHTIVLESYNFYAAAPIPVAQQIIKDYQYSSATDSVIQSWRVSLRKVATPNDRCADIAKGIAQNWDIQNKDIFLADIIRNSKPEAKVVYHPSYKSMEGLYELHLLFSTVF